MVRHNLLPVLLLCQHRPLFRPFHLHENYLLGKEVLLLVRRYLVILRQHFYSFLHFSHRIHLHSENFFFLIKRDVYRFSALFISDSDKVQINRVQMNGNYQVWYYLVSMTLSYRRVHLIAHLYKRRGISYFPILFHVCCLNPLILFFHKHRQSICMFCQIWLYLTLL